MIERNLPCNADHSTFNTCVDSSGCHQYSFLMKLRIVLSISLAVLMVSQSDIRGFAVDSPLKTLAIIDTGVDMTSTAIAKNIAYQVCFAGYKSCPNGQSTQEGPGAASISPKMLTNKEWVHGTKVASAAVQTDPSIQIIEIRCASVIGAHFGFALPLDKNSSISCDRRRPARTWS